MARLYIKCFGRMFKQNYIRYIAQILLVAVVATVIVSIESTAYTIIDGRKNNASGELVEDGQITTLQAIPEESLNLLSTEYDVQIQKNFSVDVIEGEKTYRIFRQREKIDKAVLSAGKMPANDTELVIEQNYAEYYGIRCRDTLEINGKKYTVSGLGSIPDYVHSIKNANDASAAVDNFAWVIVSDSEFEKYFENDGFTQEFTYAYKFRNANYSDAFTRAFYNLNDKDKQNIVALTEREDNRRMDYDIDYAYLYRTAGFIMGVMLIAMLAFIFAVLTRNQLRNDHVMIGSLYAMGTSKHSIMLYYALPAALLALIGGAIGIIVGYIPAVTEISVSAFHNVNSFPYYETSRPLILYLYALAMPPFVSLVVNYCVLNRTLSHSALSLMRGKYRKRKNLKINLNGVDFIHCFRIRRFIEERGSMIVLAGVLVSLVMLMLGLSTDAMIKNNETAIRENIGYDYLCTLRNPTEELETGGEKINIKNVKATNSTSNMSFSLIGLPAKCELYSAVPDTDRATAVASRALASKLNLNVGDKISFYEGVPENRYVVEISDITDSGPQLELYMSDTQLYEIFDISDGSYNAVAFKGEPDIDTDLIYSTIKTEDLLDNTSMLRTAVTPFMWLAFISSIAIFLITLYLIVSTMIDRSEFGMSLLNIMGYDYREIQSLYVNSIIYSVVIALLIAIPTAKLISNSLCPYIYRNLAIGMFFEMPIKTYVVVFIAAMLLFVSILIVLIRKVKHIDTSVVLKYRE